MRIALSVSDKEKAKSRQSPYLQAMLAAGAREDELVLVTATDARRVRAEDFDGILFAGGEDVDPSFYEEKRKYANVQVDRARDEFELNLLNRALDRRLPILGICRGVQMINVGFGGTLYQDLAQDVVAESEFQETLEHQQKNLGKQRNETIHTVTVTEPESLLSGALRGSCRVNSLHHQAIKRLGHGLKVTAHSEDGLVEAVEAANDYPFLLAVQWHPEEIANHPEQRRIFQDFIAKCREREPRLKSKSEKSV